MICCRCGNYFDEKEKHYDVVAEQHKNGTLILKHYHFHSHCWNQMAFLSDEDRKRP